MRRPELDRSISARMDALLKEAGERARAGDLAGSISLSREAWELIPEPREQWDFYPQIIARNMVDKHVAAGDGAQARAWLERAYAAYGDADRGNHFLLMLEGSSLLKLGDRDAAIRIFNRIYELYGRDGFKGEGQPYLELIQK